MNVVEKKQNIIFFFLVIGNVGIFLAFDVLEAALWWLNLSAAEGKAIKIMESAQLEQAS